MNIQPTSKKICLCGCEQEVGSDRVSCPTSWHALPKELRLRIWRLFRQERASREHLAALAEAISIIRESNPKLRVVKTIRESNPPWD